MLLHKLGGKVSVMLFLDMLLAFIDKEGINMSELLFNILEFKIQVIFLVILIMGCLGAVLYSVQDREKNKLKTKGDSEKMVSYICLGNKYMLLILLMLVVLLISFFIAPYDCFVVINTWIISIISGLSILALKAYYNVYEDVPFAKKIKKVLRFFAVILLIDVLFWWLGWRDNPYAALTTGIFLWLASLYIEKE